MLAAAAACGKFGPGDLSRTIALEVAAPDSLEEYDTVTPHARLLDGRGDSVAGTIVWSLPDSADTVALSADSISDSLQVTVVDSIKSASGGDSLTVPLAGRPVVYSITDPVSAGPVTLVADDSTRALVTTDTATTGASGFAFVQVRLLGPSVPDSVVVKAIARRAVGDTVPGSPVTFVVRFQP